MSPDPSPRGRRLFLSYGHRDATDLALRLRDDLEAGGYSVWQDEKRIRAGRAWTDEIRQGLRESDLVIALLSPHAVRRTGWGQNPDDQDSVCLDEIEYAVDACRIPVFPLMAIGCEPPFRIFRLQYLDYRAWQESTARYQDLKKTLLTSVAECLTTGRAPLRTWERLPEPWDFTAFLAERRQRFIGRGWLFEALRDRLANATSPAILLTGSPGFGKSAFFASLVHANPAGQILAYHCCQATTPATLSPAVFVRSVAAMIAARDPAYAGMLEHPDTLAALDEVRVAADPASAFETVILNLLHRLPPPESAPRVLAIDGLDEALAWPGSPNLLDLLSARLGAFPSWLKIVATTRDEPPVKRRFRTATLVSLDAATRDNYEDLRAYVTERLDREPLNSMAGARRRDIAGKVLARGNGNFLVVSQTLDAIESGLFDADDLDALAPGLHPFYEGFFDRVYKRAGVDFTPSRKLLQGIVAAQEPPSRDELSAVTGLDAETDLLPMLARLASLVPPRDGRYSPFHKTLAEWLTGFNTEEDQPLAGDYYISPKAGHRLWANSLLPRYARGPAAWDERLRRHLPTHLAGAGMWTEVADVLLDLRFLEAAVRGPGTTVFSLLADFDLVLRGLPDAHAQRGLVFFVSEIVRLDAEFLAEFPDSLFQCLWNRGHWHDSADAQAFFAAPAGSVPPWNRAGPKLSALVDRWREDKEKTSPGFAWLRALRPLSESLGTAQRMIIRAESDGFNTVAVSPDGARIIASLPEGGPIGIWDAHSGAPIASVDFTELKSVHCVRFFPAGPRLGLAAAVTWDGRLIVLDDALQIVAEVQGTDDHFARVAISPDGTQIATADWKGVVTLWTSDALTRRHRWQGHTGRIEALEFSPCGRLLASGDHGENKVRVWTADADPPRQLAETEAQHWPESICFTSDGELLYWGDYSGTIERWAWRTGARSIVRKVHDSPASVVRLLDDRRLLCGVGGAFDPVPIEVWDLDAGTIDQRLHGHLFGIGDLALVPGTKRFVSAGDSTLRIWDLGVPGDTRLEALEPEVSWVAFREPHGSTITASETSDSVWIRLLADGSVVRTLDDHPATISGIAMAHDASTLACGVSDGSVHLWDLDSGTRLWQGQHHEARVAALAFSWDGSLLATGAEDGRVCLIATKTGAVVKVFERHKSDYVQALAFCHDGRLVASGGLSTLMVWDPKSLKVVFRQKDVTHYALWFAPDDKTLIAEAPGETGIGWTIATKQRVPAGADLQAAYDAAKLRAGRRWQWDTSTDNRPNQMSLALIDRQSGRSVAHFPDLRGFVQWHPGGRIWINKRSRHVSLLQLEGP